MTDSQDWWPADYGHYGPFLLEWLGTVLEPIESEMDVVVLHLGHCVSPLNSWPDT